LIARVKHETSDGDVPCPWNTFPGGERHLLEEFSSAVRCKVKLEPSVHGYNPMRGRNDQFNGVVDFTNLDELRKYPFLFMTNEGRVALSKQKVDNMREYVKEGGFLLMDDCVFNRVGDFFYQSALRILEKAFGPGSVKSIRNNHEIFHNVYDYSNRGLPCWQGQNHGAKGVFFGERIGVLLCPTDLHCAWTDRQGLWFGRTSRSGAAGYKEGIEMGVNILMYALSH